MAVDIYLRIDGIKGESLDEAHKGWIEVSSVFWNVRQPKNTIVSTAGGHTAGRVDHSEIAMKKLADLSTPILL